MANIKSAKKRIKVINRQKSENKLVKATIATYTKKFRALVAEGNLVEAEAKLKETISLIDSAESKGVLHKNNASRKVARLTYALAKAKGEVSETAPKKGVEVAEEPKKVEAKKPATKKVAEKVEAVEEKPAKKTTAKKATTKKAEAVEEKPAKKATKSTAKKETEEKPAKKATTKKTATKKAE